MTAFRRPRAIAAGDQVADFDCGEPSLNEWLTARAMRNETTGASRTFVSIDGDSDAGSRAVAGYYCLSASALAINQTSGSVRRNMPDPIPVILIGRLAVDRNYHGRGLGASLLQHALSKGIEASRIIGARAFVVSALNDSAEEFYRQYGFEPLPLVGGWAMSILMKDAEATVVSL